MIIVIMNTTIQYNKCIYKLTSIPWYKYIINSLKTQHILLYTFVVY